VTVLGRSPDEPGGNHLEEVMSNTSVASRSLSLPTARVLVGGVYVVCVLGLIAVMLGDIVFTDSDPYRNEGPVESIIGIGIFGTGALVLGVGLSLYFVRTPSLARAGAIVLGALAVLTLVFFWSGAPGILGACAASVAGLTRGGNPLGGAARVAGLAGVFIALLNVVLTIGGVLASGLM
jgi:hypothetical protein